MKYFKLLSLITFLGLFIFSCEPEKYEPVGEPFNKVDGVKGTWKLTTIVQLDEVAIAKELALTQIDITSFFNFENYRITFNVDETNLPSTFEILNPDNAPNFFITSGKWTFDNIDFPSQLYLIKLNTEMLPVDTMRINLVAAPRDYLPLKYKFTRSSGGEKIVSYSYLFERVSL